MSRSLLAGPAGHPFHPLVVPLPIGAFVSSLIFNILTHTRVDGLPYLVDGALDGLAGIGSAGFWPGWSPCLAGNRAHQAAPAVTRT